MLKLTDKIVLKAEVETNDGIKELSRKVYFGISETEFKLKYNNHTISFRNRTHENDSKLSKFIWSLKDQNKEFEKKFRIKIAHPLPLEKASNKQFQREGEVTQQVINKYINEVLSNFRTHYHLIVIFICNVFCISKKLFEKINITSEGLSMRHETQCNVKSEVFHCLTNIVIYSFTLKN